LPIGCGIDTRAPGSFRNFVLNDDLAGDFARWYPGLTTQIRD